MLRVLIAFGWVRLLSTKLSSRCTFFAAGMNWIDKAMLILVLSSAVDILLLWRIGPAVVNQFGAVYSSLGAYFLLRFLLRNSDDAAIALKTLAWCSLIIALVMTFEQTTGRNPYVLLGGAREHARATLMEKEGAEGRFRAMAGFGHPILAGTFGAVSLPLFLALWKKRRDCRVNAAVGAVSATVIVLASQSSTPALAYAAGVFALCLWPLRRRLRLLRWGLVVTLIGLHLVMKAPVWALIARVDVIGSSSGFHRYYLVDQFIRRFADWWLLGIKTSSDWGWDMWDLANQYVAIGETAGLLPFLSFLAIIAFGFKYLGSARKMGTTMQDRLFAWALGAALFSHVVAFFGIAYFDQTMVAWYLLLAMIPVAVTATSMSTSVQPPGEPDIEPAEPWLPWDLEPAANGIDFHRR
jgi:hypothetical protein